MAIADFNLNTILFYLVISLLGFIIMGIDKQKAKNKKMRISENTLWVIAILGGAFGMILAMYFFRHKTKKPIFKFGLPLILLAQLAIYFYI